MEGDEVTRRASLSSEDGAKDFSPGYKLFWAAAMLLSGTFTTISAKALFETEANGNESCDIHDDDEYHCKFNKPWFSVMIMKLSMSLCLILYYGFGAGRSNPNAPGPSWTTIKAVALPASLDLLNTILGNIGLLWVNSSIYQMTRGSVVLFSAFLSVKYLGRTLRSFHYYAIIFVVIAVVLVGLAGIEEDSGGGGGGGTIVLGLGLIIAAQAVTAVQFIAEENLMNNKETTLDPVALVGFEGLWGMLYFAVLAPILTFTPRSKYPISIVWHEDFADTFVQLSNSTSICLLCIGYFIAILIYNVSANCVTQCLSAVVRSILEACRVMGVWIVSLLFFYCAAGSAANIGEEWSSWSYLELAGFMILMYGTFAYKALVKLPWVSEDVYDLAREDEERQCMHKVSKDSITYNILNANDNLHDRDSHF